MNLESSDVGESVQTISIKPHVLIESNVVAWFSIMEAPFNKTNKNAPTLQYYHVLATLTPEIVCKL